MEKGTLIYKGLELSGSSKGGSDLPEVTSDDNGKVLSVEDGKWSAAEPPSGLPDVTEEDNGKVLSVIDGAWAPSLLKNINYSDELEYSEVKQSNIYTVARDFTTLCSITLQPGKYILTGYWHAAVSNLRTYTNFAGLQTSAYDNDGHVACTMTVIKDIKEIETIQLEVYPSKSVTIDSSIIKVIKLSSTSVTNYSTEEQVIGTWIDGKPLYAKIIELDVSGNGELSVPHGISDVDSIIVRNIWSRVIGSNYKRYDFRTYTPWANTQSKYYDEITNTNVIFHHMSDLSIHYTLDIMYTKTTD